MSEPCPCARARKGKPLELAQCCGPLLQGAPAADAETLMRSRYTAFVLRDAAYLLATWHASTRPPTVEFEGSAKWLGLSVREHRSVDANHAEVEFVARYRVAGRAVRLQERSRFVREDARWFYVDGDLR